jgi:hypothetical protein
MKRSVPKQEKLEFTSQELSQLERELVDIISGYGLNEKDQITATRIVHNRLKRMRQYVEAQSFLFQAGAIDAK